MSMVTQIVTALKKEIAKLPDSFYNSFDFTSTGKNYTHPITWGILFRILSAMEGVEYVAVDLRLNNARTRFTPDLSALMRNDASDPHDFISPKLFLDYESPNSSDSRVPIKDVAAYQAWSKAEQTRLPYFIVTTLPNRAAPNWQLRWTSKGKYNEGFQGSEATIRRNPFQFWYDIYRKRLRGEDLDQIYFINIDAKKVEHIRL
jgi:hypothetical protein